MVFPLINIRHLPVFIIVWTSLTLFNYSKAQLINSGSLTCNPAAFYLYGTCRFGILCPVGETVMFGNSYCDVYARLLQRPVVRCARTLPCCVYGGQCKASCGSGETAVGLSTDCNGPTQGVCCYTTRSIFGVTTTTAPTTTTTTTTTTTPLPTPTIEQRQGPCGSNAVIQRRIIGGAVTQPTDWPWMVRFLFRNGLARGSCAGVLVDDDTVLTVAHCVFGLNVGDISVSIGDHDLTRFDTGQQLTGVRQISVSPRFIPGTRGNDFALIKLSQRITFAPTKLPACLPDPNIPVLDGAQCFVAGWGIADNGLESPQLRAAPVRLMSLELCNTVLAAVSGNPSLLLPDDIVCTDTAATRTDACLFDDGGMLACQDVSGRFTLMGLVSEYSCGNLPTVYTRVSNYTEAVLANL